MDADKYLSILNPEQLAAVKHSGAPLLILAGAGSGKTRVITTKIAWLIGECGVSPYEILAVTFTNKAAHEMRERVTLLEQEAAYAELRTFHSFGAWFLRRFHEEAGLDRNFTIYDDDDGVSLLASLAPELLQAQVKAILHKISRAKDYCLTPDDPQLDIIDSNPLFRKYYTLYQNRLDEIGNLDFGDLILKPVQLLTDNEQVCNAIHNRFKVILVDEYQDSNVAQFKLLQALAGDGTYICVVGDDDQSIYKFRGAEIKNILSFADYFPGTEIIRLERNYRSVASILAVADDIVSRNSDRLGKTLKAERPGGNKPALIFLPDQDREAELAATLIEEAAAHNIPYRNWAILYRTNAQSLTFESMLLRRKIPYQVVGSLKFYEREEIKDALAYLALTANPRDEVAFRRIVNKPARGIGNVTRQKIAAAAVLYNGSLVQAADMTASTHSKKAAAGLKAFVSVIKELTAMLDDQTSVKEDGTAALARHLIHTDNAENSSVSEFLFHFSNETNNSVIDATDNTDSIENTAETAENATGLAIFVRRLIEASGLDEYHKSQDEISGTQRSANLQELVNNASLYELSRDGLSQFLEHIELDRTALAGVEDTDGNVVTLITLHNTKGLEFSRVIMTGLELGIFPREDKFGDDIEEERRLMYVGVTRARDELYLTSCGIRRVYGSTSYMQPSPFLSEINRDNLEILGNVPQSFSRAICKTSAQKKQGYSGSTETFGYEKGDAIYHDDYGYGSVISFTQDNDGETVMSVQFENSGTKQFMPKYQSHALMKIQHDGDEY